MANVKNLALPSLLFLLAAIFVGAPHDGVAGDALSATGIVKALDLSARTVTINRVNGRDVTLNVNGSTALSRNSKRIKLRSLVLGDAVVAQYDGSTLLAASLTGSGPIVKRVSGKVRSADKGEGTVRLGSKEPIVVHAETRISRKGQAASLSALTRKDRIVAQLKPGTGVAVALVGDGPEATEVEGVITAVDPGASQVSIAPENGTPQVTLLLDQNTMIEIDGVGATLADLVVGQEVEAYFDPVTFLAFSIEAEGEEDDDAWVEGTVAAVDTAGGTLTIAPVDGTAPIVLRVAAGTEIEVNGEEATLAEVQVGMPVRAEYDAVTMEAEEIEAGVEQDDENDNEEGEASGTVAAISQTSVTIDSGEGSLITLIIDSSTEIEVYGEDATWSDIRVGDPIEAEYEPLTLVALELEVGAEDEREDD